MKYSAINKNDMINGEGINVSIWVSGCPHHCKGCFNPETWDFNAGKEFTQSTIQTILEALTANNVTRGLSILGGEPLCPENIPLTKLIINSAKEKYPNIKINLWTGYLYEEIIQNQEIKNEILPYVNTLIDGPFIESEKDITLKWRGSRNQRVIMLNEIIR